MAGLFAALIDEMDAAITASLGDGTADYLDTAGLPAASGVEVMIDREAQHAGADGMFVVVPISISWRKAQLATATRGGRFVVCTNSYIVEDIIADDGHMVTAACMEAP
ncbi:head-tail joining protein [Azotobacter beijerinckii]|uniref:Uncharacterized protein n=1 Tax=Azotobacter beijerinckii TaxID=170623 RepID=A0A1I3ZMJ7_9GAMM|nr:hypothetical protein [Azotobacter beijerinckii]SFB48466.1 hypothetical protein SAMN04244571_03135 [Azotobacter beijerinckii]SFK45334.1 hypothetical protein SAMN04244574_00668 [Azotobacter beijerinckii]